MYLSLSLHIYIYIYIHRYIHRAEAMGTGCSSAQFPPRAVIVGHVPTPVTLHVYDVGTCIYIYIY